MSASMMRIGAMAIAITLGMTVPGTAQNRVRVSGGAEVRVGPVRARVAVRPPIRDVWYKRHDRVAYRRAAYLNMGLAFCRDGRGHPRYGWSWCVEEGFLRPSYERVEWQAVYPQYVTLNTRYRRRAGDRVHGTELCGVLGRDAFARLQHLTFRNGVHGVLWGRWEHRAGGGLSLVVHERGVPIAEYVDQDRDGRVDVTFIFGAERHRRWGY